MFFFLLTGSRTIEEESGKFIYLGEANKVGQLCNGQVNI
jgi:hypothetical protein